MKNLKKLEENNKGYILMEVIVYIVLACLIMSTCQKIYSNFANNSSRLYSQMDSIENGLLDIMIYKNSFLKADDMRMEPFLDNRYSLKYNIKGDEKEIYKRHIPFKKENGLYKFHKQVSDFKTSKDLSVLIDEEKQIIFIESEQGEKRMIKRTFNLYNCTWKKGNVE